MTHSLGGHVRRLLAAGAAVAGTSLVLAGAATADAPSNPGTFVIGVGCGGPDSGPPAN